MNKIKINPIILAALLLAALLSLFFAYRYGARSAANTVPAAAPAAAPATAVRPVEKRRAPVKGAGLKRKISVVKPDEKRMKRVSPLIDPGEALIGSASTAPASSAPGLKGKNK